MSNFQASFQLADNIDQDKVFLINLSDIDKRLDTDYYRPELLTIEKRVSAKATKKLQDFANTMASGATPSVSESSYYADKETGIPFLRVQNLTINGTLNLENVKFISHHVHENQIKRSQVSDSDLLIKITGVGRMAVASVPPKGFIGNTNQHMVVLRTNDREKSRYLANYLNLDVVEKLASRRATGGTRPALDYSALRSIPVIENINFEDLEKAKQFSFEKKLKAQNLLDSIDDYLLAELGIDVPDVDNSLSSRMFTIQAIELSGGRFDALQYKSLLKDLILTRKDVIVLSQIVLGMKSGIGAGKQDQSNEYEGIIQIRPTNISKGGKLNFTKNVYVNNIPNTLIVKKGDVLFNNTNSQELVGKTAYYDLDEVMSCSNHITRILVDHKKILPKYLGLLLNLYQQNKVFYYLCINWNNQSGVGQDILRKLPIVLPNISKQQEIVQHIDKVRATATQLQQEANEILAQAKQKIERMILGEEQ